MPQRLEDRIRKLCSEALREEDADKVAGLMEELREGLRLHIERVRAMAGAYPNAFDRRATKPKTGNMQMLSPPGSGNKPV